MFSIKPSRIENIHGKHSRYNGKRYITLKSQFKIVKSNYNYNCYVKFFFIEESIFSWKCIVVFSRLLSKSFLDS